MLVIEKDVESYLVKKVKEYGGMCLKYPTVHTEGIPDRLVLMPGGQQVFVELKRPKGGRLSEVQKYQIDKLRELGFRVNVLKNKAEIDEMLRSMTYRHISPNCEKDETKCVFYDANTGCKLPYGWRCHKEMYDDLDGSNR